MTPLPVAIDCEDGLDEVGRVGARLAGRSDGCDGLGTGRLRSLPPDRGWPT